ncbi:MULTISPECIES: hypothetical protein [unclassified Brenneria]|uniref:hypothetical protein n=1 Tax=unclassified Brenneria TaxID=2634434 RepID=UPI0018F0DD63|nr:hypothetical protein [Brenneria sp. L3-3C-1]MBJ7223893.1 hypothetical protein [Brenneria sp. L3-3C-1]MEE3645138.1 hypothetical protein [Brenneria sp. L3_3C_1]
MEPFKVSPHLSTLLDCYPDVKLIVEAAKNGGEPSKAAIARLWLSEGIPFAFKNTPALYEVLRVWLGNRLDVDPKEIHLCGSARIGQSLAPKKLGTNFGSHSDLDLFVVSEELFDRVRTDFNNWSYEFEGGLVQPTNEREGKFWVENNNRGQRNLQRGFLDSNIVPNRDAYPTIKNIAQSMWLLKGKLDVTKDAPSIKSASVRCYKNWGSYVRQVVLSLA